MLCRVVAVLVAVTLVAALEDPDFQWKEVEFAWPDKATEMAAIASGEYIPVNNLPLGLAVWKDKMFITVPRWKAGTAATLAYFSLSENKDNKSPVLIPYPDWASNILPTGDAPVADGQIISTFRVWIDECDRLWVMDTGLVDLLGKTKVYGPPALVVYDLNTDKLLRRFNLKKSDFKPEDSFFANIIIDVDKDHCDQAFAYLPDLGAFTMVVYSWAENDAWVVKHNYFHFDPLEGNFNVDGLNFQWTDGVFGVALTPPIKASEKDGEAPNPDVGYRTLYFHAMASRYEFSVSTRILRNRTLAADPTTYDLYKLEGNKGELTQSSASVYDDATGVLFMTQINKDGVACWNTNKELKPDNFALVLSDHEKLIFANELKIDSERNLWILSDRMPRFKIEDLPKDQINYRLYKIPIDDLIKGSACAP